MEMDMMNGGIWWMIDRPTHSFALYFGVLVLLYAVHIR